jgi:hypothetical protein
MRNGYKRAWALVDTTELDDLLSRLSEELVHPERKLRSDRRTRHLSHTQRVLTPDAYGAVETFVRMTDCGVMG